MRIGYASVSHNVHATYTPPPPGGTWTPAQMASIFAWWDPAQGVTLASGKVSSWVDAANGVTASQATASLQPPFSSTTMNGFSGLSITQTAQIQLNATSLSSGTPMSCISIGNATSVSGATTIVGTTVNTGVQVRINSTGHLDIVRETLTDIGSSTGTCSGAYAIYVGTVDSSTYAFKINGSSSGSGANSVGTFTGGTVVLFNNPLIGNTTEVWAGSIGDIILVNAVASSTDIEKAEGYLAWKYSLASLLPSGHPYKSAAP